MTLPDPLHIRTARADDLAAAALVFSASRDSLSFLPRLHSYEEDVWFIREMVFPTCDVYVAEVGGQVVGLMALNGEVIEHLYVHPDQTGRGVGTRFIGLAKTKQSHLRLWTFAANLDAQRFYARHGFRVVEHTDGAGNVERLPDLLLMWTDQGGD